MIVDVNSGNCFKSGTTGIALPRLLEIRTIDGEEILFAAGRTFSGGHKGRMYVKNLTNGKQKKCSIGNSSHFGTKLKNNNVWSMTVSNDGDYIYLSTNQGMFLSQDGIFWEKFNNFIEYESGEQILSDIV